MSGITTWASTRETDVIYLFPILPYNAGTILLFSVVITTGQTLSCFETATKGSFVTVPKQ